MYCTDAGRQVGVEVGTCGASLLIGSIFSLKLEACASSENEERGRKRTVRGVSREENL